MKKKCFSFPYIVCLGYVLKPCSYNKSLCMGANSPTWPSWPMGNPASNSRTCLLNHSILGQWVSMHGMDSLLTAEGWAPACPSFFNLLREGKSPDWLPSTHPHYKMKWFRGVLLALKEVAWHRSCPHCSILSLCKTGNIPWSMLPSKPYLNIAWESINSPGTKPAWPWPKPSLQAV